MHQGNGALDAARPYMGGTPTCCADKEQHMSPYRHHFEERSVWHHLWANAYGVAVGVLFILVAVGNVAGSGGTSTIARATETGATDEVWSTFLGFGGAFILYGLVSRRANIESAGLVLTIIGLVIAIGAVLNVVGVNDATRLALSSYSAFVLGQIARLAWLIYCSQQVKALEGRSR